VSGDKTNLKVKSVTLPKFNLGPNCSHEKIK